MRTHHSRRPFPARAVRRPPVVLTLIAAAVAAWAVAVVIEAFRFGEVELSALCIPLFLSLMWFLATHTQPGPGVEGKGTRPLRR